MEVDDIISIIDDSGGGTKFTGPEVKWAEISDKCERERFLALSQELKSAGVPNEVSFIECDEAEFPEVLDRAKGEFSHLRIGGALRETSLQHCQKVPSSVLTLKLIDSFVKEKDGAWWPRCFIGDAIMQSISEDMKNLDLTAAILVVGAGPDARAAISAFVRVGFNRVNLTDVDETRALGLMDDLRRSYFNVQFNYVARHMITQLPSIHSVAVNTIESGFDDGLIDELSYFNFLKPGGVWLDLPLVQGAGSLDSEASSVGALVEPGINIHDRVDRAWSETCFGVRLYRASYRERLARLFKPT